MLAAVGDVLIYGDTIRSQELRHEVPVSILDPFLYAEKDGVRHLACAAFEQPRLGGIPPHVFHPFEEFGLEELRRSRTSVQEVMLELAVRAAKSLGIESASVPGEFPLVYADRMRAEGIELIPDQALFDERRRVKSSAEVAGIRRAQAAAEAGMKAARELLRRGPRRTEAACSSSTARRSRASASRPRSRWHSSRTARVPTSSSSRTVRRRRSATTRARVSSGRGRRS
jgi:Xaa-Pro aminopeptidase